MPGVGPLPSLVHLTLGTLAVSGLGIGIALVIAIPIGVGLGHIHRGSFVAINIGNLWRALPSLAVLAIAVAFLGIGLANVELALVVLAVPPIVTNAYVGVDGIDSPEFRDLHEGDVCVPVDPATFADRLRRAGFVDPDVEANEFGFRFTARSPVPGARRAVSHPL